VKLARRPGKRLHQKTSAFTKSSRVPTIKRSASPTSLGGSEMSESCADSDLSACTDLEDLDQLDDELLSSSTEMDAFDYLFKSVSSSLSAGELSSVGFVPVVGAKEVRRPSNCIESTSYDWLEDYTTPEVAALLADDWLLETNDVWLHDVAA